MMTGFTDAARECRTFDDLAEAFSGRPDATLAFAFLHFGYGKVSYSPVYMHKGEVPDGPMMRVDAVMLDPLPVSHYTHSAVKTDAKRADRILNPGMIARYADSYSGLPVVVKSSAVGHGTAKTYLPLRMIENLSFAGDPIGIALNHRPVDESLYHLGDDIFSGYIRSDERINGVSYPSVKSLALWDYMIQHMKHDGDDGDNIDDLAEAPFMPFSGSE